MTKRQLKVVLTPRQTLYTAPLRISKGTYTAAHEAGAVGGIDDRAALELVFEHACCRERVIEATRHARQVEHVVQVEVDASRLDFCNVGIEQRDIPQLAVRTARGQGLAERVVKGEVLATSVDRRAEAAAEDVDSAIDLDVVIIDRQVQAIDLRGLIHEAQGPGVRDLFFQIRVAANNGANLLTLLPEGINGIGGHAKLYTEVLLRLRRVGRGVAEVTRHGGGVVSTTIELDHIRRANRALNQAAKAKIRMRRPFTAIFVGCDRTRRRVVRKADAGLEAEVVRERLIRQDGHDGFGISL